MDELGKIAIDIDEGLNTKDTGRIKAGIDYLDRLLANEANYDNPIPHYYRANAFSALRQLNPNFQEEQFSWQQPEYTEEIISLRRAVKCFAFENLDPIRRCQILTNLGNALNTVGRPIEAIESWDKALAIEPKFAMAAANRANGLAKYSAALYDPGHQCIFLEHAAEGFRTALRNDAIWDSNYPESIKDNFHKKLQQVEAYLTTNCDLTNFDPFAFELGANLFARELNQWRLNNRLFLNPLNDLGTWPVAAQDIFHLPNHAYNIEEEPRFVRYFDLIKQEYIAACVLLHEGVTNDQIHPADQTLLTFEHCDYSISSIELEKQKAAFRIAYSLLDKCAVFINSYFKLGHDPKSLATTFRKIWFQGDPKRKCLSEKLPLKNWRLRGLYSISLDLFDADLKEIASPLAIQANAIRNAAEHRFLSIYELIKPSVTPELCESITTDELFELSLHTLKIARATIMGLSLAMHHQELYLNPQSDEKRSFPINSLPKKR